jgi:Ca-activated chloride channel family protein
MLILDASGSMWGQIDGQTKIEVAREVMSDLVESLADDLNVGLVAYGHRRKGDCSDVEQIIPLGPLDKPSLNAQIQRLSPKGKTPLSASVREVARGIQHLEDETTIVLVSDGKETCGGDPCALVRELKNAGIKFVLHAVGFDVDLDASAQLRCMADVYYTAANATELQQAIQEIGRTGQVKVVALRNGQPIVAQVHVSADSGDVTSGRTTLSRTEPVVFKLDAGRYQLTVTDPEIPALAPVIFDAVEVAGAVSIERVAEFAPALLRLAATKNGRPTAASYRVTPPGQTMALASTTAPDPQAFWLAPGNVDIAITEGGVDHPETVRFTAVALNPGQTVERTADFSAGRLRIHATRNGQPIRARVEVLMPDEERNIGTFHTSVDPGNPSEKTLKPGVYAAVVIDETVPTRPEVVFSGVEVIVGALVERTADFSDGTLQLVALRNGELIAAEVAVMPVDEPQPVATDASTHDLDKPLKMQLPVGEYTVRVTDTENPAQPSIDLGNIVIAANKLSEHIVEFQAAILEVKAVKNEEPVSALASLVRQPTNKKRTILLPASEGMKRLFLEPGRFDLIVRQGKGNDVRTVEFNAIEIALGDTVERIVDFSDGMLKVSTLVNGKEPHGGLFTTVFLPGGNQKVTGYYTNPYEARLPPGKYDVLVTYTGAEPDHQPVWFRDVELKGGESVERTAEFASAFLKVSTRVNGKDPSSGLYTTVFRPGGKEEVTGYYTNPYFVELLPGVYDVRINYTGATPNHRPVWFRNVELVAGETVEKTGEFHSGYLKVTSLINDRLADVWTHVFVEGETTKLAGYYTNPYWIELQAGKYDVRVDYSGADKDAGSVWFKGVDIVSGETAELTARAPVED